jgi:nitroreductase
MKILDYIKERWSPRAFSNKPIGNDELSAMFEAARWAPSSMNEQPWRYFYALNGDAGFETMLDCLVPQNRQWAKEAPLLILSVAEKTFKYKSLPNRHALHDLGAANTLLAVQAGALGMQAHQMGGFDMEKTLSVFNLSAESHEPASFIAVGYPGDPELLPEELSLRELAPRERNIPDSFIKHFS